MVDDSAESRPILAYGQTPRPNMGVWAGAVLLLAALGLAVVGGCFLIGVLILVNSPNSTGGGFYILNVVLYGLASICFVGAALLFTRTAKRLLELMR